MSKKEEASVELKKGKAYFSIIGKVNINDYTFKLNAVSDSTGYKYSRINLGIETATGNNVYSEAMGGFNPTKKENLLYVCSAEDIKSQYTIDWADRFDEKVTKTIHKSKFINIALEKYIDKPEFNTGDIKESFFDKLVDENKSEVLEYIFTLLTEKDPSVLTEWNEAKLIKALNTHLLTDKKFYVKVVDADKDFENNKKIFELSAKSKKDDKQLNRLTLAELFPEDIAKCQEKTFSKRFLSWYDAIAYVQEHIKTGMILSVGGVLKYSLYKNKVQVKKEINNIYLAKEGAEFKATFVQTILLDKDSVSRLDAETNEYTVSARVLDYVKMWGKKEVKQNIPYNIDFTIKAETDKMKPAQVKKFLDKFFKVRKNITELAVEGNIIEGTQMGEVTEADIPDDMLELIEFGVYTKDEILGKLMVKGDKVSKFVITKPYVQVAESKEEGGEKKIQYFLTPERYNDEDLVLDFMYEDEEDVEEEKVEVKSKKKVEDDDGESDDSDSWLTDLEVEE